MYTYATSTTLPADIFVNVGKAFSFGKDGFCFFPRRGRYFLNLAVSMNSARAMFLISRLEAHVDSEGKVFWLAKSAEYNHAPAMRDLAEVYKKKKNYAEATKWMLLAAQTHRHVKAALKMGEWYFSGEIPLLKKNMEKSMEFYRIAASGGDTVAMNLVGFYRNISASIVVNSKSKR